MGLMVDTNVFISFEKSGKPIVLPRLEPSGKIYISAVTASELLMGVHRADSHERKQRRSFFVETVLSEVSVLNFTLGSARIHAELCSYLSKQGKIIGAHDLMIAATACANHLPILTNNVDEFSRVPGLRVIAFP